MTPPDDGAGSETPKHSPLPWRRGEMNGSGIAIKDAADRLIAYVTRWLPVQETIANANLTVEACNNYERLREENARLREALAWAEKKLCMLVTEDDGAGAFLRGTGIELAGFGAGMGRLRAALSSSQVTTQTQEK